MRTEITAEPDKQELFIHREFKAPVDTVFKAFSDPNILVKFFAPKGTKMVFLSKGYKEGRAYRYRHTDSDGNILCTFKGAVHEITIPHRIVITSEMEELPESGHSMMEIYEFAELEGKRTKLTIQNVCRSVEDRDDMIKSGMEGGVVGIFQNLDELLAEGSVTSDHLSS